MVQTPENKDIYKRSTRKIFGLKEDLECRALIVDARFIPDLPVLKTLGAFQGSSPLGPVLKKTSAHG